MLKMKMGLIIERYDSNMNLVNRHNYIKNGRTPLDKQLLLIWRGFFVSIKQKRRINMKFLISLVLGSFLFFATGPAATEVFSLVGMENNTVSEVKAEEKPKTTVLTGTGVSGKVNAQTGGVVKSLKTIANMVTTIAIILSVISLVFGAIKLSFGGGNPQSRSMGIAAIVCACIGAYVAYKAYDIVGWAVAV